jgi:hypothetical protein
MNGHPIDTAPKGWPLRLGYYPAGTRDGCCIWVHERNQLTGRVLRHPDTSTFGGHVDTWFRDGAKF